MALFRADFDEAFSQEDEAGHLNPLGNDVADDLPPLALAVHPNEEDGPTETGHDQKQEQRMAMQGVEPGPTLPPADGTAFG